MKALQIYMICYKINLHEHFPIKEHNVPAIVSPEYSDGTTTRRDSDPIVPKGILFLVTDFTHHQNHTSLLSASTMTLICVVKPIQLKQAPKNHRITEKT